MDGLSRKQVDGWSMTEYTEYNDRPAGGSGRVLPPSRFGAGYTVGGQTAEPGPTCASPSGYGAPVGGYQPPTTPEPSDALRYPDVAGQSLTYPVAPVAVGSPMPVARTNSMAVAALVCSLVLAPLGIVFGHIALSQIKRTGEDGKGFAIAGLVIGYIFTGIAVLWLVVFGTFLSALASAANGHSYTMPTTPAAEWHTAGIGTAETL